MGLLDRETGKVRVKHLPNRTRETLHNEIKQHVAPGSEIFTDEWVAYNGLDKEFVHTNGLENFWSLLKRGLKGTYVSVEPFHLHRYIDEQAFRYNERKRDGGDGEHFDEILSTVAGRHLTYNHLQDLDRQDSGSAHRRDGLNLSRQKREQRKRV
jgi:transposase-like protein